MSMISRESGLICTERLRVCSSLVSWSTCACLSRSMHKHDNYVMSSLFKLLKAPWPLDWLDLISSQHNWALNTTPCLYHRDFSTFLNTWEEMILCLRNSTLTPNRNMSTLPKNWHSSTPWWTQPDTSKAALQTVSCLRRLLNVPQDLGRFELVLVSHCFKAYHIFTSKLLNIPQRLDILYLVLVNQQLKPNQTMFSLPKLVHDPQRLDTLDIVD